MIQIRRVARRFPVGRVYEVDMGDQSEHPGQKLRTRAPVSKIEPVLGVGDAWSLIDAADRAWDRGETQWVSLFSGHENAGP